MPELPEVEILKRHLSPLLPGKNIRAVKVLRQKVLFTTTNRQFVHTLIGARFINVERRAKFLIFKLRKSKQRKPFTLIGHLGMTGRFYLQPTTAILPKHAAVTLNLGRETLVYVDQRYFGRLTLDTAALARCGPEPLSATFTAKYFADQLRRSTRPIKVKLLDQTLVAGIGNIYASEALFRAGISPRRAASRLTRAQTVRLRQAIRAVLRQAIRCGSTIPLNFGTAGDQYDLFYYGKHPDAPDCYEERLLVYDRAGQPCVKCGSKIRKITQAARSTYYCPRCQK